MAQMSPVRLGSLALACWMGWTVLTGCGSLASLAQTPPIPPDLENQVLQIIRDNPQVILESLQDYQRNQQVRQQQAQQKLLDQMRLDPDTFIGDSPTLGSDDRRIILVEFSDYQCPFCAQAHGVLEAFMAKNGDRVTFVYKHFPLTQIHPEALPAAAAAWAAQQQGKYWEFHEALFAQQGRLGEVRYGEIATELGLDLERFNRDRTSAEALSAINRDRALGEQLGLRGTPTLFLNGQPVELPLTVASLEAQVAALSKP
jgi:protein-disulfide isomerase